MNHLKTAMKRLIADIKEYGLAGIVFLVYYLIVHMKRVAFCPMLHMTGLPCAGCGLTRAFLFLLRGELMRAAYINPMVYTILAFILYCGYFRYWKGSKIKGFSLLLSILILGMLLFYFYRMYLYFPDRVPYVYAKDNVFADRIPGYEDGIYRLIRWLRGLRK